MRIKLVEWFRTGHISPLQWGSSEHDFSRLWSSAQAEIAQARAAGYPFLMLDSVEFYFTTDCFEDLYEICIKAWTLARNELSTYFDYGWLHKGLTNAQVQATLQSQGIAYQLERGLAFQTPNLRTASGVLFSFYPDFDTEANAELMNVYLSARIGF
jgi:hypothetical protein